jgi:hypothetical protein
MGFLDNLESNLKSMESAGEREEGPATKNRREADRAARVAIQPFVEKLRKSPFTDHLLRAAHMESFRIRVRITAVWIGDMLRLELPGKRLELIPSPSGVRAQETLNGVPAEPVAVDFESDPAELLKHWLSKTAA